MFPDQNFSTIASFMDAYHEVISIASSSVDRSQMQLAATLLIEAYKSKHFVWVCGNGGSASIANHLVCDHAKGARSSTSLRPRVTSLVSNMEIVTAISNDISYDDIFAYQLENLAQANDILIMISSSGDSENIIKACDWANKNKLRTIALTGFSGGRLKEKADVNLHVKAENYGIIEDIHQSLMHMLAQFIRLSEMDPAKIRDTKF